MADGVGATASGGAGAGGLWRTTMDDSPHQDFRFQGRAVLQISADCLEGTPCMAGLRAQEAKQNIAAGRLPGSDLLKRFENTANPVANLRAAHAQEVLDLIESLLHTFQLGVGEQVDYETSEVMAIDGHGELVASARKLRRGEVGKVPLKLRDGLLLLHEGGPLKSDIHPQDSPSDAEKVVAQLCQC